MNINLNNSIVEQIKEIGEKYNINKILILGSRARCDNMNNRYIDLAIYYQGEIKI